MPAVTRVGDLDIIHCSVPVRSSGSPNVFVNGLPVSRQGDFNNLHLVPGAPCGSHLAPIALGSLTVKINGLGCGRVADAVAGCTFVATGSTNVFAGG